MQVRRFMATPQDVADAVRAQRADLGLTQIQVAERAGVTRQFVADLEKGHPRAELGKMLDVLRALQIHALAIPAPPANARPDIATVDMDAHLAAYAEGKLYG